MYDKTEDVFGGDEIKVSIEQLNPTAEQSEKMWQRLSAAMDTNENVVEIKKKRAVNQVWKIAAAIAVMFVIGAAADGMTGGNVYAAIKEFLSFGQTRQDVAGNIADINKRHTEIYAPAVYDCDGKILVFGALRGLIVYDMEQGRIAATIDTQKIDCVYYNSDSKHTRVVRNGDELIVFNMTGEKAEGNYYVFDLSKVSGGELPVAETGSDEEKMQAYVNAWKAQDERYTDTFDFFCEDPNVGNVIMNETDSESKYSERSILFSDMEGKEYNCFIYVQNGLYYYSIYDYETDIAKTTIMNLEETIAGKAPESTSAEVPVTLPEFTYTGDNPAIAAIWEYSKIEAMAGYGYGEQVVIPGYVIHKEVQKDDELLVFGNFYEYGYQLMGNVIECTSGGEKPACFRLRETPEGYEVVSVEVAGDGAEYDRKIREFTEGYPGVYELFFSGDPYACDNAKKEFVSMYVKDNNLDVKYVKDYGWDPVPLFE
nr:hypothetical protein [Lachnospiraceae bacterium]MBQ8253827.1 hypothetical protein [Lachnospiraceae bacterium]